MYDDLFDSTRVANLVSLVNVVRVSVFYLQIGRLLMLPFLIVLDS